MSDLAKNEWVIRTTIKQSDCFVCYKPTTTCLVFKHGQPPTDFFFACQVHLNDRGFATCLDPPEIEPETGKKLPVKSEEKNEDKDKETEKDVKNEKDDKDKEKIESESEAKDEKKKDEKENNEKKEKEEEAINSKPKVKRFSNYKLHRDILYLRQARLNKIREDKRLDALLKQLPSVPKNELP